MKRTSLPLLKRREFIAGVGGVVAWPLVARGQQPDRMRRVGAMLGFSESAPEWRLLWSAFVERLAQLGWIEGRNVRIVQRWTDGVTERIEVFAKELVKQQPDVIFSATTPVTAALFRATHEIPIVFTAVSDPVGSGFVASLPRPGGNVTGFINLEASLAGKQLDLLKKLAPAIKRAAIMFNPDTAPGGGSYYLGAFETAARSLAIEPIIARVRSVAEIEAAINALGGERDGLVLMTDSFLAVHHLTIIALAARNDLPTIFDPQFFTQHGGLASYGLDYVEMFQRAAGYVDRILRGAKPADLPVELPTKFTFAINLKTAKTLGLTIPTPVQLLADEVIE
jgi:putative ABC transport system substrate-binding protein